MIWGLLFVVIEAFQFVYFGSLFQNVSSFLFGFLVFGVISVLFIGGSAIRAPCQLRLAIKDPFNLIGLNIVATLAWASYLTSVELIEPAVFFIIFAGVMPIVYSFSHGSANTSRIEWVGIFLLLLGTDVIPKTSIGKLDIKALRVMYK